MSPAPLLGTAGHIPCMMLDHRGTGDWALSWAQQVPCTRAGPTTGLLPGHGDELCSGLRAEPGSLPQVLSPGAGKGPPVPHPSKRDAGRERRLRKGEEPEGKSLNLASDARLTHSRRHLSGFISRPCRVWRPTRPFPIEGPLGVGVGWDVGAAPLGQAPEGRTVCK